MSERIVFFEVKGGSDKEADGHRKDTMPMVEALRAKGYESDAVFYDDDRADDILTELSGNVNAYVSRVNPGTIPGGEGQYFDFLRKLEKTGAKGMPSPDTMINMGSKDALTKLTDSKFVPSDTAMYCSVEEMKADFPQSLAQNERVIKQNRGSTGEGIWHVSVVDDREFEVGQPLPMDTKVKCVEAMDNKAHSFTLSEFIEFCDQYFGGDDGLVIDMKFLHRIKEGEIRVLMVGREPVFVVHKKPADSENAFSATLFSGAVYTYDSPDKWPDLMDVFKAELPMIQEKLSLTDFPLLWTADFILDNDEQGDDTYCLGEMNCSCVGFTSHLDIGIQDNIAEAVIRRLKA